MTMDSVVAEVRATREAYAARFGYDPLAMARDLRERERTGNRVVLMPLLDAAVRGAEAGGPNQPLQPTAAP